MTIKNLWSLNVDEVITAEKIKSELGRGYEVFFPINSQLKDVDLLIYNLKTGKSKSVQVKGSRTYEPGRGKSKKMGNVKIGWNVIHAKSIFSPTNKIDFFVFVLHEEELSTRKRMIKQKYLIIPINDFRKITKTEKTKRKTGWYHYSFVIKEKTAMEFNNTRGKTIDFSKYVNNFDLLK